MGLKYGAWQVVQAEMHVEVLCSAGYEHHTRGYYVYKLHMACGTVRFGRIHQTRLQLVRCIEDTGFTYYALLVAIILPDGTMYGTYACWLEAPIQIIRVEVCFVGYKASYLRALGTMYGRYMFIGSAKWLRSIFSTRLKILSGVSLETYCSCHLTTMELQGGCQVLVELEPLILFSP